MSARKYIYTIKSDLAVWASATNLAGHWGSDVEVVNLKKYGVDLIDSLGDILGMNACVLVVITPDMRGFQHVIDLVNLAHTYPGRIVFVFHEEIGDFAFTSHQVKSLNATGKLIEIKDGVSCGVSVERALEAIDELLK